MNRTNDAFLVVLVTLVVVAGCGGPVSPTSLATSQSAGGALLTPTPAPDLPSTFSFVPVDDMTTPSELLPVWGLRGSNSAEAVKMMSFCGTGVIGPADENEGLRPMRKPMGPMIVVVGAGFSSSQLQTLRSGDGLGANVPLSFEMGEMTETAPTGGRIYVIYDPLYTGLGKSATYVVGGLIVGARVTFGPRGVFTNTFRHELGHTVLGLCHHGLPGMMSGIWPADSSLSLVERDNAYAMSKLKNGTVWATSVGSSSSRSQTYTLEFDH